MLPLKFFKSAMVRGCKPVDCRQGRRRWQRIFIVLLILLPGMDGTGHLFEAFRTCLPPGHETRIVRYPTQDQLSYEQLEELVACELPASGKYIVIAESFSGPIALQIANRDKGELAAVVVVSSFAYRPLGWTGSLVARLPLSLIFRLPVTNFALRTFLMGGSAPADELKRVRPAICQVRPQVLAGRLRDVLASDYGRKRISASTELSRSLPNRIVFSDGGRGKR